MAYNARSFKSLLLSAAAVLSLYPAAHAAAKDAASVDAGSTWVVGQTTHLTSLTVAKNATIAAPKGYSLTLTVDGVGTPIEPGAYKGNVVLTVTKDIVVRYGNLAPVQFRTAVYVDNGAYVPEQSVAAAVVGGTVTNASAKDISITSKEEKFNGIVVTGDSKYSIVNPKIDFTGNGGNDFAGYGAGIMSSGNADVTVENAKITTKGVVRTAVFVGGHSNMTVNNSSIEVYNGVQPVDYKFTLEMGKMMEVPWMLGLVGNVRATNLVDYGTAHYNNVHIKAQGWGALSTDDAKVIRLYATDSLIETVESGYGSYSIGDSLDYFSHCTFNVADMALIMAAEGSGTFTDGTVVNSRRYGVIMHSGSGGTLTIEKGSVFNTKSTVIEVKGRGAKVVVDNAELNTANGIILQAMVNDDPFARGGGPGAGGPPGAPGGGAPPVAPAGAPGAGAGGSDDVTATFRNVTLKGDIVNSRTAQGDMAIAFDHAAITGAISTATAAPSKGVTPAKETYYLIGDVKNTFGATGDKHGLSVSLNGHSAWTVDKTSYLTGLTIAKGATITAPKGYRVIMTVDGVKKRARAGRYKGKIVLTVTAGG